VLKLFYAPGTCALASHIALEEAGAEYEAVRLDFRTGEQRQPDYLAINSKGRVPALVTDEGVLTETPAILVYVAQRFPGAQLAPIESPFALGARPGVQQLSVLDRPCRARARQARLSLGRRSGGAGSDAAQGSRFGRRMLRADRA
jgi:glutathione S-transferase